MLKKTAKIFKNCREDLVKIIRWNPVQPKWKYLKRSPLNHDGIRNNQPTCGVSCVCIQRLSEVFTEAQLIFYFKLWCLTCFKSSTDFQPQWDVTKIIPEALQTVTHADESDQQHSINQAAKIIKKIRKFIGNLFSKLMEFILIRLQLFLADLYEKWLLQWTSIMRCDYHKNRFSHNLIKNLNSRAR